MMMAPKILFYYVFLGTFLLQIFPQDSDEVILKKEKLNILMVFPSFGGHFASAAAIVNALGQRNHSVVAIVAGNCSEHKLEVSNLTYSASKVMVRDWVPSEVDLEPNILKALKRIFELTMVHNQILKDNMKIYLDNEGKAENFDLAIVDCLLIGVEMETEIHGIPTIANFPGDAGPVEYVLDRMQGNIPSTTWYSAVLAQQILVKGFHSWIQTMMKEENIPGAEYLNGVFWCEYSHRFPVLIHGSRFFYPAAGSDVRHTYIGASRRLEDYPPLDQELKIWLDQDTKDVIYMSFGAHVIFTKEEIEYIVSELQASNSKFRFIWSVNPTIKDHLDKETIDNSKLYYRTYFPQVALLNNSKVIAFISHGGMNSLFDAFMTEKLIICMPGFYDQVNNCDVVKSLELGIETHFPFKPDKILRIIDQIVFDKNKYLKNIKQMKKTFQETGEYDAMEDFIITVATEKWMAQPITHPLQSLKFYLAYYFFVGSICGILILVPVIFVGLIYYLCCRNKIKQD